MNKHLLVVCAVCGLLTACSTRYNPANTPFAIYHPIAEENVRKLEKGITTPDETIKLFGTPDKKNISDKGERYVYGYLGDTLTANFEGGTIASFLYRQYLNQLKATQTITIKKSIPAS